MSHLYVLEYNPTELKMCYILSPNLDCKFSRILVDAEEVVLNTMQFFLIEWMYSWYTCQ